MVGGPTVLDGHTVERILFLTTERVPVEATHWSTGLMARYAGATQWQVRQVWQAADVTAHRLKTLTVSVGRGHRRRICLAGWFLDARDPILWTCTFLGDLA